MHFLQALYLCRCACLVFHFFHTAVFSVHLSCWSMWIGWPNASVVVLFTRLNEYRFVGCNENYIMRAINALPAVHCFWFLSFSMQLIFFTISNTRWCVRLITTIDGYESEDSSWALMKWKTAVRNSFHLYACTQIVYRSLLLFIQQYIYIYNFHIFHHNLTWLKEYDVQFQCMPIQV